MPGTLIVKPQSATLSHDTEFIARMDPYCVIKVGNQTQTTPVCENGGKKPKWLSVSLSFHLTSESVVNVEIWDKDLISRNDLVGQGSLPLVSILSNGINPSVTIPLFYKGKSAGTICILFEWYAEGAFGDQPGVPGFQQQAPVYQQPDPAYQEKNKI